MASEAQKRASARYCKANRIQLALSLNKKYDGDIIDHLARFESKAGYIKNLIRADIAANNALNDTGGAPSHD